MVKATAKETNDGSSTDSGDERDRNDENTKITLKCPHILKSIDFTKVKKYIKQNGFSASCCECEKQKKELPPTSGDTAADGEEEEYDRSLWMCLRCGQQFCGRLVNKHAIAHYEVKLISDKILINFTRKFKFLLTVKKLILL